MFHSIDEMPPADARALLHWLLSLADTKHRIGLQFSQWVTGTPALEAAVSAAAITQDELGHARSFYSLLRDFPGAPESIGAENDLEARETYYAPAALLPPWESWLQVVAILVVLDNALQIAISQMLDSAFQPVAGRIAKIIQEESFHRVFGHAWLERLARREDEVTVKLQKMIDWAWLITSQWIGPDDDSITNRLLAVEILAGNSTAIRNQWLAELGPVLSASGLEIPVDKPSWSDWDSQFRDSNHA